MNKICFVLLFGFLFVKACDIYITSKCPTPPAPTEHNANWTLYCNEIKGHIDCINKKLRTCKNIQEFGPALETIKWNIKVIIEQGRSHGCTDLVDKIKLPRVPRKKKPTDTTSRSSTPSTLMTERAIVYIDPNCHKNLVDMYCERVDNADVAKFIYNNSLDLDSWPLPSLLFSTSKPPPFAGGGTAATSSGHHLSEATCKRLNKHAHCLQTNFRAKCEQSMALVFIKVDKFLQQCFGLFKMRKHSSSDSTRIRSNSFLRLFFFTFYAIFLNFLM